MIRVVKLQANHVIELKDAGALSYLAEKVDLSKLKALEKTEAFTVLDGDRNALACGGVIEYWEGRAEAWAFFRPALGSLFIPIHKAVKRYFDLCPIRRIEAVVDCDFPRGHRWIKSLGFELETERMKFYQYDGRDSARYVRIK